MRTEGNALTRSTHRRAFFKKGAVIFLDPALGPVAIIRPTSTKLNGAVAAIEGFVDDGLFIGQKDPAFRNIVFQLAEEADAARREV